MIFVGFLALAGVVVVVVLANKELLGRLGDWFLRRQMFEHPATAETWAERRRRRKEQERWERIQKARSQQKAAGPGPK